jgi:hypothetical protein
VKIALAFALASAALGCGSSHPGAPAQGTQSTSAVGSCDGASDTAPTDIACTGLYGDAALTTLGSGVREFAPSTPLWSDGASKKRWLLLPDGQIDTSNPDAWVFPVGTKAWKDFAVAGKRIETRFFWKVSDTKWVRATYVWSDDESHATRVDKGVPNARGTGFDVPDTEACDRCHEGRKERLLGVDAIGLGAAGATGVTLASLAAEGRLTTTPPATPLTFGTATSAPALAWLHVNCGAACHNENENATANATGLRLKLRVDAAWNVSASEVAQTTLGVGAKMPSFAGEVRIVPGRSDESLLIRLAGTRGDPQAQMPPVGSSQVDDTGMAALRAWIDAMPKPVTRLPEAVGPQ